MTAPTTRSDDRAILRLAVPAFFTLIAEPLYVLADTAVVGHLGTPQLAGLAIASAVLLGGHSLFIFLAYGTTGTVARLLGAGRRDQAAHEAIQSLWLAAGCGVAFAVIVGVFSDPLVAVLGGQGEVAEHALVYLRISLVGFPALLVMLAGTGYLRGMQDTRTPLVVAVVSATLNLVLELALIPGLGFGIGASALSTVVAQGGAAAVYLWVIGRAVRAHGVGLAPVATSQMRLARAAGALFVRTAALRLTLLVSTAVAARIGTVSLAAHQIAYEVWSFLALALDAVAIAGQALIGRFLGAGEPVRARRVGRRMLRWGVGAGVVTGSLVAALAGILPWVFTPDAEVAATATFLLLAVAVLQPLAGAAFTLDGILIGAGDLAFLARAMVLSSLVFAVGAAVVVAQGAGIGWLWVALGLWMAARVATTGARYRGDAWLRVGAVVR
jgi:putative MATE family efflux protein